MLDQIGSSSTIKLLHDTLHLLEFLTDYLLQVISRMVQVMLMSLVIARVSFLVCSEKIFLVHLSRTRMSPFMAHFSIQDPDLIVDTNRN